MTHNTESPEAFFTRAGELLDWETAQPMPKSWTGIAKSTNTLMYLGREGEERSFNPLYATTMSEARKEVAARFAVALADGAAAQATINLALTRVEIEMIRAAVQEYRELIDSPTSADRDARGQDWANHEVVRADILLHGKLSTAARVSLREQAGNDGDSVLK